MQRLFNHQGKKNTRKQLRQNPTEPEKIFWQAIRNKQIAKAKFRRQVSIGPYVVDFYSYDLKLVIELDGESHYKDDNAQQYDSDRTAFLGKLGIRVVRFSNKEVMENLSGCLVRLLEFIDETPSNSPWEAEE